MIILKIIQLGASHYNLCVFPKLATIKTEARSGRTACAVKLV